MKVESDTTSVRRPPSRPVRSGTKLRPDDRTSASLRSAVTGRLPARERGFVACAPRRLDVMAGLADYMGALVLSTPLAHHACVAVQEQSDPKLTIHAPAEGEREGALIADIPLDHLYDPNGAAIDAARGRALTFDKNGRLARCVAGAVVGTLPTRPAQGLVVCAGSTMDDLTNVGRDASLIAAAMVAVARTFDIELPAEQAAATCQHLENEWLGTCNGISDAACALHGQAQFLGGYQCAPFSPTTAIQLPDELTIVGIDSGVVHPKTDDRSRSVRTASFMGRLLIDRIIQHDGARNLPWDGYLARVSVTDYVERFRDRLPTKILGRDFLERFGETGDPVTHIEPDMIYKVRSRTEHHIYEHTRSCQFAECFARAIRNGNVRALESVGELMYASHWSYGQRCGLGSVETDLFVQLVRQHGAEHGLIGAKISGQGCGGVVTVLMESTDEAFAALNTAIREYEGRTELKAKLLQGSTSGALVVGAHPV